MVSVGAGSRHLMLGRPDAQLIREALVGRDAWWSSALLVFELRGLARCEGFQAAAERVARASQPARLDRAVVDRASRLDPAEVRSLDAIHPDAAVVLAARGEVATEAGGSYVRTVQVGCAHHGLAVEAPVVP